MRGRAHLPRHLLVLAIGLVLAASAYVGVRPWATGLEAESEAARAELATCSDLASRLHPLLSRVQERSADSGPAADRPLEARIGELAERAGIHSPQLAGIEPGTVLTLDSERKEEVTRVHLKDVGLTDLVHFLYSVQTELEDVLLKSLSLDVRRDAPQQCDAEVEVSHMRTAGR